MQREVNGVPGASAYVAASFEDAWDTWYEGNLSGDVPWEKEISEHSIFPRVVAEKDIPRYLAYVSGGDTGVAAMAIPAISQEAASNIVQRLHRKQAPSSVSAARTRPSAAEKFSPIMSSSRKNSTGGSGLDIKGKGMASLAKVLPGIVALTVCNTRQLSRAKHPPCVTTLLTLWKQPCTRMTSLNRKVPLRTEARAGSLPSRPSALCLTRALWRARILTVSVLPV